MSAAIDLRAARAGFRTPTLPEVVRDLQRGAERTAVTVNAWNGAPPSDLAIAEVQNSLTGMQALLRQARSLTEPNLCRK